MDKDVKFRRNVYIILLCVLLLGIATQLARSEFILKLNHNDHLLEDLQAMREKQKLLAAAPPNAAIDSERNYCLVFDEMDELSTQIKENTEQVLRYMKQPHTIINMDQQELNFSDCKAILLTASLEQLDGDVDTIEEYVWNGGSMFVMRSDHPGDVFTQLSRKLGIINFSFVEGDFGIELTSNVLIGQKGVKFDGDYIYNDSIAGELDDESMLLARSNKHVPLMWKRPYGDGQFVMFNGSSLNTKETRGLITGGISMLEADYIYPIFNAKLFYIDDFPAPIPRGLNLPIYREYKKDLPAFFRDIWWPDMLKAAKKYDVKYTGVVIQSYQDQVEPPFNKLEDEELHGLISYGREIIKSGGEIGIHGYNHQAMQTDPRVAESFGYKTWRSVEDMEAATEAVLNYIAEGFPKYKVMSYVPPSNVLGPEGRQALIHEWPNLAVIASLYGVDESNRAYVQEFEVADDGIIEMPRVTSGFFDVPYNVWFEANTMTSVGLFSHFLHPDDLTDIERGQQKSWKDLYKEFEHMLSRLDTTYPWLRSITSNEAGIGIADVLLSKMSVKHDANQMQVSTTADSSEQFFIFRTDKKIGKLVNCNVRKVDDGIYLVTAYKNDFSIGLGR
jgi:hypothetical protein